MFRLHMGGTFGTEEARIEAPHGRRRPNGSETVSTQLSARARHGRHRLFAAMVTTLMVVSIREN